MSINNTQEELKRQAVQDLATSRVEIVAGIDQLRLDLSPKLFLHRFVDRHMVAVVCVAIATGAVTSMLILRRKPSARLEPHPRPRIVEQPVDRPQIASRLWGFLAGSVLPALIKSGIGSVLRVPGKK